MNRITLAILSVSACVLAPLAVAAPQAGDRAANPYEVNPRWLLPLDREDRQFLDEIIGFAPPDFTDNLTWVGSEPVTWDELRGKVVVMQTWNTRHSAARTWPARAARATQQWDDNDVVLIALHTPESADTAEAFLERRPLEAITVIDPVGEFCDALGAYKTPVNVIIDRAGAVRYAGLDEGGITAAVAQLVEEKASDLPAPKEREVDDAAASEPPAEFPSNMGDVGASNDFRGKRAPEFYAQEWLTRKPDIEGKVLIVDFWATWCGPCVAMAPHMSELSTEFKDDLVVIGLSSEQKSKFVQEFQKKNLRSKISYTLALDPSNRMASAIKVKSIPYVVVIDSDWIVRWQGHPAGLRKELVAQIVAANGGSAKANPRMRWANEKR